MILVSISVTIMAFGKPPELSDSKPLEWLLTVSVTVPHGGCRMSIDRIYQSNKRNWVIVTVTSDSDDLFSEVMVKRSQTVIIQGPKLPVSIIVIGPTWHWPYPYPGAGYTFVSRLSELESYDESLFQSENKLLFMIINST